jgi:hypothetical protein
MDAAERTKLQGARLRMGLGSLTLLVAGLALMIANVAFPLAAVLAVIGVVGLNLVRVGRP